MIITKPSTIPTHTRPEPRELFTAFLNNIHYLQGFRDWLHEESYTVIEYQGWVRTFYYEDPNQTLIARLMFPDVRWHFGFDQPARYDSFMEPIRRQNPFYDELMRDMLKRRANTMD